MKNNFSVKIIPELKIANFLITILQIYEILWFNLFKILDIDKNNLFTHFCFSKLLILREKKVRRFFLGSLKYQKNIEKTPYKRVAQKSTILQQAPQITLFLTHPVYKVVISVCLPICLFVWSWTAGPMFLKFWLGRGWVDYKRENLVSR